MWSGEGSEQLAAGQWLNPMMYQNVSNDQVDWASLAQQWIQMKETFPTVDQMNVLAPPPPPPLDKKEEKKDEGEKGEAPMDMELDSKDEENGMGKTNMMDMNGTMAGWGADWAQWQQWGWSGWNAAMPGAAVYPMGAYGEGGEAVSYPQVDGAGKHTRGQGFPPQPGSQFIRHPNRVWRKGDKTVRGGYRPTSRDRSESPDAPVIDAAKRKTLPAWIREGLEKMEREKQKKLIQEQDRLAREAKRNEEADQFDPLNPTKSKFDTDSEHSDAEEENEAEVTKSAHPSPGGRFPPPPPVERRDSPPPPPVQRRLSKAEILENVMGIVRKQLTQLLMRVTSEEIERCASEVFSVFPGLKAQQQSAQRPPTSRSVKGNLGLGIYDDSATESSESEDEVESASNSQQSTFQNEDVLRDQMNQRKRDFSRVEREIEMKILAQEEHERQAAQQDEEAESEEEERVIGGQVHRTGQDHDVDNGDTQSQDSGSDAEPNNEEVGDSHHSPGAARKSPRCEETRRKSRDESVHQRRQSERSRSREVERRKDGRDSRDREREKLQEPTRRESNKARDSDSSERSEKKRKKKKKKRDSSRSRKGSEERRSREKYRDSSRGKNRDSSRDRYGDSSRDRNRESSRDRYRDSSRERYGESSRGRDKYRNSSRERNRDSSRDSRRTKKRQRSRSVSDDKYAASERSHRSDRKSNRYDSDDSTSTRYSSRKKGRYSKSPDRRKKKSHKRSRSRSRSYSYSSSSRHRR